MNNIIPDLSEDQWHFLAVLEAFGMSIPIHIAGHLAPLLPGPVVKPPDRLKAPLSVFESSFFTSVISTFMAYSYQIGVSIHLDKRR